MKFQNPVSFTFERTWDHEEVEPKYQ